MKRKLIHETHLLTAARKLLICGLALGLPHALGGCDSPLTRERIELTREIRNQVDRITEPAEPTERQLQSEAGVGTKDLDPARIKELDSQTGPDSYTTGMIDLGPGLDEQPGKRVGVSLKQAVEWAVRGNLDVRIARLEPSISAQRILEAQEIFESIFFTEATYEKVDQPRQRPVIGGLPVGTPTSVSDTSYLTTGIRRTFSSGTQAKVETGWNYINNKTRGLSLDPDPAFTSRAGLGISQPLLRNFGRQVNEAYIRLAESAHQKDLLALEGRLLETVGEVEENYWLLRQAMYDLAVRRRTLEQAEKTLATLRLRKEFDAGTITLTRARNFTDQRRADVIRAERNARIASDRLKALIQNDQTPLGGELVIDPIDSPTELAVKYNARDVARAVVNNRPDVRSGLLDIEDAGVRLLIADNQKLPTLDVTGEVVWRGMDEGLDQSTQRLADQDFISYLMGIKLERSLTNEGAEAAARRTRLERQSSVLDYQKRVRDALLGAMVSLRAVAGEFKLIAMDRAARRSAADNVRAIEKTEEAGAKLEPTFLLDLKLNAQQRLADAEVDEYRSVIEYNIALSRFYRSQGLLLRNHGIKMGDDAQEPQRP